MKRIALLGAAAAAVVAAGAIPAAAEAKTRCTCVKTTHHVRHKARAHRVVARRPVVAATTVITKTVYVDSTPRPTYVSGGEYLPDPQAYEPRIPVATRTEDQIASDLNRNLDLWRSCGWSGQERAAAVFATWSRTHLEYNPTDPRRMEIAWKPYGLVSQERMDRTDDPNDRAAMCNTMVDRRTEIKYMMDRDASALLRAHAAVHR